MTQAVTKKALVGNELNGVTGKGWGQGGKEDAQMDSALNAITIKGERAREHRVGRRKGHYRQQAVTPALPTGAEMRTGESRGGELHGAAWNRACARSAVRCQREEGPPEGGGHARRRRLPGYAYPTAPLPRPFL